MFHRPAALACALLGTLGLLFASCGPPPSAPPFPAERVGEPARSAAQLDGEILGVDRVTPSDRLASGIRLTVQPSAAQPVLVDLAPDWYIDRHGLRFGPSERVHVEGVRRVSDGKTVIYATRITRDGKTIELRDPTSGEPLWNER